MDDALACAWVAKAFVYGLAQLGIGIAVVRWLALPHAALASTGWDRWFVRMARVVASLLAAALVVRLWVQTASAFGPNAAFELDSLRVIALESRWGEGWRAQVTSAAAMLATASLIPAHRFGWSMFATCAVGVVLSMPLLGHASGSLYRYGVHALHGLGAGAWIGTLGVMTCAAWRQLQDDADTALVAGVVRRFSPVALTAAACVGASGVIAAWLYVGSWASLGTTTYGRVLLLKLLVVAGVGGCGWANWRDARSGRLPKRAVMTLEYLVALLAVALTGVLTETEHP